jgi:hypothetical protein
MPGVYDVSERRREELSERLGMPEALLSRTDLAALGLPRRAVDAVFRAIAADAGVVVLPGYSRPFVRVRDYRALVERSTFRDDRVRP